MDDGDSAKHGGSAKRRIAAAPSASPDFLLTSSSFLLEDGGVGGRSKTRRKSGQKRADNRGGLMKCITRFVSRQLRAANEFVDPVLLVPTSGTGGYQLHYSELFGRKCLSCNSAHSFELTDAAFSILKQRSATAPWNLKNGDLKVTGTLTKHRSEIIERIADVPTQNEARKTGQSDDLVDVQQDKSYLKVQPTASSQLQNASSPQSLSLNRSLPVGVEKIRPAKSANECDGRKQNEAQTDHIKQERLKALTMGNHAVAGALAGVFVSLCLHPLDTVKTVLQSKNTGRQSLLPIVVSIISSRGVSGLYRGLGSNLASSAPISAIYTFTYESVKAALLPRLPEEYHSLAHCAAGGCASIATSLVYTPSERVKQQMQIGAVYRNSWLAFIGILHKGGFSALYAGWEAVLCRNIPQSVIKFFTYEGLKRSALSSSPPDAHLTNLQTLAFGGLAGSTAALFTTPFDVVKTRLQTQTVGSPHQYTSVLNALHRIAAEEGIRSLYRGLIPRLAIYISQGALFFASYEFFKRTLALGSSDNRMASVNKQTKAPVQRSALVTPA